MKNSIYTTAPSSYDYGSTHEINSNVGSISGKTIRQVEVRGGDRTEYLTNYQIGRYRSGLNFTQDSKGFKDFVEHGLINLPS